MMKWSYENYKKFIGGNPVEKIINSPRNIREVLAIDLIACNNYKNGSEALKSIKGLRHRAYSRRIPRETQPVFSVRFASEVRRTTPPTSGRNVAEVAYVPPRQTPMTQTFRLGWSVASSCDLQARGSKARKGQASDLSRDSIGRSSANRLISLSE